MVFSIKQKLMKLKVEVVISLIVQKSKKLNSGKKQFYQSRILLIETVFFHRIVYLNETVDIEPWFNVTLCLSAGRKELGYVYN